MSRKQKGSDPPKKPLDDDIHTTPPEGLVEALEDSEELKKKGEEALEEASKSKSLAPSARVVPLRDDEGEEEDEEAPDPDESQEDLAEATGVFATSVDIITNALLVILGKFDESLGKQDRSNRRMSLNILLIVVVTGAVGYAIWRIENVAEQLHDARIASLETSKQAREAATEMKRLMEALKETDKKVEEVKEEQKKQPDIAIEPDGKGGAKVVVTPKCKGDAKDCERPAPKKPKAGGKKPPPAPPPTAKVEIPIPGATSPKGPTPKKPQEQAPPPPPY